MYLVKKAVSPKLEKRLALAARYFNHQKLKVSQIHRSTCHLFLAFNDKKEEVTKQRLVTLHSPTKIRLKINKQSNYNNY